MRGTRERRDGFSLVELMMVVGFLGIILALAVPAIGVGERVRVNNAASEVRQALQTARLRAVAVNRPMEIRFNCPSANRYRVVEAGWPTTGRCDESTYPYPAPSDAAYRALPRYDGPVQYINNRVTLTSSVPVLQFGADGRVTKVVNGTSQSVVSVSVSVTSNGYTKTINVNSLGRVVTE